MLLTIILQLRPRLFSELKANIPNRKEVILAGCFNLRVGKISQIQVLGSCGENSNNNNKERALDLCEDMISRVSNFK